MSPIKSSIELAMEKAEKMTMTEEEKREAQKKKAEEKAKVLIRRYLQHELSSRQVLEALRTEEPKVPGLTQQLLKRAFEHINLKEENKDVLELIEALAKDRAEKYKEIIRRYRREADSQGKKLWQNSIKRMEKEGISGSAVIPNLDKDKEWQKFQSELKDRMLEEMQKLIST